MLPVTNHNIRKIGISMSKRRRNIINIGVIFAMKSFITDYSRCENTNPLINRMISVDFFSKTIMEQVLKIKKHRDKMIKNPGVKETCFL